MDGSTSYSEILSSHMEYQKRDNVNKFDWFAHVSFQAGNQKKHKCNQCDYASVNTGHLRTHMRRHAGEKNFKCNQCDYASSEASNLRAHLKRHSREKILQMQSMCNQCDICSSRRFEATSENSLWTKIFQMPPMRLCINLGSSFEDAFENSL